MILSAEAINRRTYDNLLKAGFDPSDIDGEFALKAQILN
jgi:hypothetical protein